VTDQYPGRIDRGKINSTVDSGSIHVTDIVLNSSGITPEKIRVTIGVEVVFKGNTGVVLLEAVLK
jgi:hypothetical protein